MPHQPGSNRLPVPQVLCRLRPVEKPFVRLLVSLAIVATSVLAASSADASIVVARNDGNDAKGPLDLQSVRVKPVHDTGERFLITTGSPIRPADLDGTRGWIEVDFDTDANHDVEYWVAIFYHHGKLRGLLGKGRHVIGSLHDTHRVGARAISFDVTHQMLKSKGSYDFAVFSLWTGAPCSKKHPCIDAIPNRYPLLRRDFTAPAISWGGVPSVSTDASADLTFDVNFSMLDDAHGTGVASWTLQQQQDAGAWNPVNTGHATVVTAPVTGVQGEVTSVRVVAVDNQGNKSTSAVKTIVVPWDDQNLGFFSYTVQTPTTATGITDAFLGTTSTLPMGTIVTAVLPAGSNVCVLGGPPAADASATLSYGSTSVVLSETTSSAFRDGGAMCGGAATSASTTVTLEVTSAEPFVFDGLVLVR